MGQPLKVQFKKHKSEFTFVFILAFILHITSCSLNNSSDTGPRPGVIADDIDFNWDLWPELEENEPLKQIKLEEWPELKTNSVLILGDESIQGNWGLLLKKTFSSASKPSWFLSTCMTASDFKTGKVSPCGYWDQPFKQSKLSGVFLTVNQLATGERLAPKIISDDLVETVVLSFGQRLSVMTNEEDIKLELSSIELMAKWAHSAGKKCYVIEPVKSYFMETKTTTSVITSEQKNNLKNAIEDYCDWVDANQLKQDFISKTNLPVDDILNSNLNNPGSDYINVKSPELEISTQKPNLEFDDIEIPKNVLDPSKQVLQPLPQETEETETQTDSALDENNEDSVINKSINPKARPVKVSLSAQEEIRSQLEVEPEGLAEKIVINQEALEPKYLWNGHNNGKALTEIGKKYLNSKVASYLLETKYLRDIENFCPKYWNLKTDHREFFWLYLFSAIARYENHTFNPSALHLEKTSQRHSIGIFQVDTKNCGYGSDSNKDQLYDMDNNFKCALTKGTSLVKAGKQVADGRYSGKRYSDFGLDGYWSVLRKPYVGAAMNKKTGEYENVSLGRREKIRKLTIATAICK